MNNNDKSGVNTILLVIIVMILVAAGVWFLKGSGVEKSAPEATKIDVTIPAMNDAPANNNQPQ